MGFMFVLLLPCPELSATPPATLKFGAAYAIPTERLAITRVALLDCLSVQTVAPSQTPTRYPAGIGQRGGRRSSLRFSNRSSRVSGSADNSGELGGGVGAAAA